MAAQAAAHRACGLQGQPTACSPARVLFQGLRLADASLPASFRSARPAAVSPAAAGPGVAPAARKRSRTPSSDPRPPAASRPRQPLQELVLTASGSSVRRPVAAPSLAAAPALQPPEGGAASWLRSAARPPRF